MLLKPLVPLAYLSVSSGPNSGLANVGVLHQNHQVYGITVHQLVSRKLAHVGQKLAFDSIQRDTGGWTHHRRMIRSKVAGQASSTRPPRAFERSVLR